MPTFNIQIPAEYLPGIVAAMNAANKKGASYGSPDEFANAFAAETALRWCEQYKVGQYWEGPVNPEFNADGTPFEGK